MTKCIVCVRDEAAECFGTPFFVTATGLAIRQFTDEVNRAAEDNPLYKHPVHFSLWLLGLYDEVTGAMESDKRKLVDAVAVAVSSS